MVKVSPKFQYPSGYFAVGLPQAAVSPTPDLMAPKIISQAKPFTPEAHALPKRDRHAGVFAVTPDRAGPGFTRGTNWR